MSDVVTDLELGHSIRRESLQGDQDGEFLLGPRIAQGMCQYRGAWYAESVKLSRPRGGGMRDVPGK